MYRKPAPSPEGKNPEAWPASTFERVPVNKELLTGTVPVNKKLFTGTVSQSITFFITLSEVLSWPIYDSKCKNN